jgi:hypothetical protein
MLRSCTLQVTVDVILGGRCVLECVHKAGLIALEKLITVWDVNPTLSISQFLLHLWQAFLV